MRSQLQCCAYCHSYRVVITRLAATAAKPSADPLEAARAAIRTKQFERAVGELRQQADRGSIDAQYLLGLALLNGLSQQPDREQGCRWLRTAAERGQAEAQFVLASILFTGGKSDAAEANLWLERAARGGNAAAQRAIQEKRPPLAAERKSVLADAKLRGALLLWAAKRNDAALTRAARGRCGSRERRRFRHDCTQRGRGRGCSGFARGIAGGAGQGGRCRSLWDDAADAGGLAIGCQGHRGAPGARRKSDIDRLNGKYGAHVRGTGEPDGTDRSADRRRRRRSSGQFAGLVGTRRCPSQQCRRGRGRTT